MTEDEMVTNSMDMDLGGLRELVMDREACVLWTPKPLCHRESDMTERLNSTDICIYGERKKTIRGKANMLFSP